MTTLVMTPELNAAYARAQAVDKMPAGTFSHTPKQQYLASLTRQAKQTKIARSAMGYRMRLAAMTAADSRKGKTW